MRDYQNNPPLPDVTISREGDPDGLSYLITTGGIEDGPFTWDEVVAQAKAALDGTTDGSPGCLGFRNSPDAYRASGGE
jgi:hypothetical protein